MTIIPACTLAEAVQRHSNVPFSLNFREGRDLLDEIRTVVHWGGVVQNMIIRVFVVFPSLQERTSMQIM